MEPKVALVALFLVACGGAGKISDVGWMAGHWSRDDGGTVSEEQWSVAAFGKMVGTNRTIVDGKVVAHEFLLLEEQGKYVLYRSWPHSQTPTTFQLVSVTPGKAVFENPKHDFPQRLEYVRDGNALTARISGTVDGKARSEQWSWQLTE